MWFSKKQELLGNKERNHPSPMKRQDEQAHKSINLPQNRTSNPKTLNKLEIKTIGKNYIQNKTNNPAGVNGETIDVRTQMNVADHVSENIRDNMNSQSPPDSRQKPVIHLPHKPQIPTNTERLHPRYKYKKLAKIKEDALSGDLGRVNFFAVVSQVIKPLTKILNGKFTIICQVVDESVGSSNHFNLHFFTPEDTIIKNIEQGDVLRLHRVKIELFNYVVDGRLFNSNDILLFKKNAPEILPVTLSKNSTFNQENKSRVEALKKWYKEFLEELVQGVVLMENIQEEKVCDVLCQVVSRPESLKETEVKVQVTDGTVINHLTPALPLHREGSQDKIVTEIAVFEKLSEYEKLKAGDIVLFREVKAAKTDKLRLIINSVVYPDHVDPETTKVEELKKRLKRFEGKKDEFNLEIHDEDGITNPTNDPEKNNLAEAARPRNIGAKNKVRSVEGEPKFSLCGNKSCNSPNAVVNVKKSEKLDTKNKELRGSIENPGGKTRKPLFTVNYEDLSDATDETSEVVDGASRAETEKGPSSVIVTPANTSFGDLLELVKSKYCSPRKLSSGPSATDQMPKLPCTRSSTNKNIGEKKNADPMMPVVEIMKLTDKECKSLRVVGKGEAAEKLTESRKRVNDDDLEDASTVFNMTFQEELSKKLRNTKKKRLDSDSTVPRNCKGSPENIASEDDTVVNEPQQDRGQKVSNWLYHPDNRLTQKTWEETEEFDLETIKQILGSTDTNSPDLSKYITTSCKRLQLFLVEVIPDPASNPLDLVSGYCFAGCHQLFLYSQIHWLESDDSKFPCCPDCMKIQQERELELMFMAELLVMDKNGHHGSVIICREHAEKFLNCTVRDFLMDVSICKTRCQLLMDYTLLNTLHSRISPMLDMTVSMLGEVLCLVNSTLKLPSGL